MKALSSLRQKLSRKTALKLASCSLASVAVISVSLWGQNLNLSLTDSGRLSASAVEELISQPYTYNTRIPGGGSYWTNGNAYNLYRHTSTPGESGGTVYIDYVVWSGSANTYELEYRIRAYNPDNGNLVAQSDWTPNNYPVYISMPTRNSSRGWEYQIDVRRVSYDGQGNRYELYPGDMNPSNFTVVGTIRYNREVQTTPTLPQDWLQTSTVTYRTQTTTTANQAYDNIIGTIPPVDSADGTPPSWFARFMPSGEWWTSAVTSGESFISIFTDFADDLGFIWVLAGISIVGLLIAWLLH